ncbi:MAG TPA: DUF4097 family beta strand repeat-containing protein [Pyrinomonadaceae bacterium]|nr:DUF4097 family beta strand repeat-containing protein [Pyrinomonadaceae bacterium]
MMQPDRRIHAENSKYTAILFIVIAFAVITNAIRDLNQLHDYSSGFQAVVLDWFQPGPESYAVGFSAQPVECTSVIAQDEVRSDEFRWTGLVAPGRTIEIKGVNGDISAEPTSGANVEVLATKKARRSDPALVDLRVLEHSEGVTICVVYPSDDPNNPNSCEPGKGGRMNVRNNDVKVDVALRVPAGVNFSGRTVNGEIVARSLASNVVLSTVNGSITISTSGYARANTVNGEIAATLGDTNWPDKLEFNTVNGGITLDLPQNISAEVKADTFNGAISSDFPLAVVNRVSRKHLSGTIGSGGRELILKTLNGSINLRRAG